MEDIERISKNIKKNLQYIKEGNNKIKYDIYTDVSKFYDLIKIGKTKEEKLQILIMCYYNNPTLEELENLTLNDVMEYIKATDEYYNNDKKIFEKCINLIEQKIIDDKEKMRDLFTLSKEDFLKTYSYLTEEEYINTLDKMWEELGDIPVNEEGTKIEQDFYIWKHETDKEDIWHWFDNRLKEGIGNRYFN